MSQLENLTRFAATCMPSMSRKDEVLTLVVVSGRFELPPAGVARSEPPPSAEEQGQVRLADEHAGEPTALELVHEGQGTYTRPGTDLYLHGLAWAPGGKPTPRSTMGLRVGPCQKGAVVFGERVWGHGVGGASPSRPLPFTSMPLSYTRCFGGTPANPSRAEAEAAEHNPVGRGLHGSEREAIGQPLPNFEDPQALLAGLPDRPRPCGFGPVARHFRPRRGFAGTYDQAWQDHRMPLWPKDLDERFFCAAAPGLCAQPHLQGGELVRIAGMAPDGAYEFPLPRVRLEARFEVGKSAIRRRMVLDAISFETEASSFVMTWRTYVAADPLAVAAVVVRALAPWEAER
jgi:hypothetical protein